MAKGYFIANIEVHDPETFEQYREKVPATIEQYGGRYVIRGGEQELAEGDAPRPRTVVLEFPSLEQVKTWYNSPEYQAIVGLRLKAADGRAYYVEGV